MKLYTKKEAAKELRRSTKTLEKIVARGEIDSVMIGRRRMFSEYDLTNYCDRNRTRNHY